MPTTTTTEATHGPRGHGGAGTSNTPLMVRGGDNRKAYPTMANNRKLAELLTEFTAATVTAEMAKKEAESNILLPLRANLQTIMGRTSELAWPTVEEGQEAPAWLPDAETRTNLEAGLYALHTVARQLESTIGPMAGGDREAGNVMAHKIRSFLDLAEDLDLPEAQVEASKEILARWDASTITVTSRGTTTQRGDGANKLGYLITATYPGRAGDPHKDGTSLASLMAQALPAYAKAHNLDLKGAAEGTWKDAGQGAVHADLKAAYNEVKAGADRVVKGVWTVTAEGRQAKVEAKPEEKEEAPAA